MMYNLKKLFFHVFAFLAVLHISAKDGLDRHNFLYAGESMQRRVYIIKDGQINWEYNDPQGSGEISDAVLMTDGNILIAHQYAITEVGSDGKKIWNYAAPEGTEIHTIQPLGNNHILYVQNGHPAKVIVMKIPNCSIVREFELPAAEGVHGQFRNARLTSKGTLLVANMGLGYVGEYDADGKEINRWDFPSPWSVSELDNGNLLIVGDKKVREIRRNGTIVKDINTEQFGVHSPQKAVRLSNGNTIVNEWWNEWGGDVDRANPPVQAIEYDTNNNIVWKLCSWQSPDLGPATTIQPLYMAVDRKNMLFPAWTIPQRPTDPEATPEACTLYQKLWKNQNRGTMYGHQDDLMCGHTWWNELGRSDTKEAVGDYPAVAGFELGELELGGDRSLDSVAFRDIRERIQWWHRQGGVITISWHVVNPISAQWPGIKEPNGAGSAWDVNMLSADGLNAVRSILPGGSNHALFNSWLDRLARFFQSWRDDDGKLIPFIFRPWHEHSGSFFWWGRTRCYDEEYASLWRYTVDYMRGKGLHNILYAYNTDKVYSSEEYLKGYPGDEYIDMLSFDWYGSGESFIRDVSKALDFTTALAKEKQKLFALSECGPISEELQKVLARYESVYLLTWRHAPPRGGRPSMRLLTNEEIKKLPADARERYLRWLKQPKHEDLLKIMKRNNHYMFLKDILSTVE